MFIDCYVENNITKEVPKDIEISNMLVSEVRL